MGTNSAKDLGERRNKFGIFLKYFLPFLLSIVFIYIALYNVRIKDVYNYIYKISLFWAIIFVILNIAVNYVRSIRWKVILYSVKPSVTIKNLFAAIMFGYGINCVLPRVGEVSRVVLLGKWENLSKSALLGTVVIERIIDIIFFAFAVIISAILWSGNLYDKFPWLKNSIYISLILISFMIFFFFLIIRYQEKIPKIINLIMGRLSNKLAKNTIIIFERIILGISCLKSAKSYFFTILLSALIMFLYSAGAFLGFFIIGMEKVQPVSLEMGWIVMSISSLGFIIPTPGGTGSYHALTKTTLVLLYGFSADISIAYAFITHIISTLLFIFSAIIVHYVFENDNNRIFMLTDKNIKNQSR